MQEQHNTGAFDLVVASHLRWSFVWQRPQQLLSRLAQYHRILFVEEPVFAEDETQTPTTTLEETLPNVFVLTPQILAAEAGDTPLWLWPCRDEIDRQVGEAMQTLEFQNRALWLYTPTPDFLVETVHPEMMVYDVMDELANFKYAPPQLKENERRLLAESALVFTGGASMYDSKKHHNPNTHLFASGVDSKHYAAACDPATQTPEWMDAIPSPRAAYIGVIDERMDYDLIAQMADAHPQVQFLMCGPVVKVDPNSLPQRRNLHYPGQQAYADLPRILKGSDICLMPFAQNDATRYISPTKTLEYMATHRPIVSTPIPDVVRFYSDIVYLGETPEQFVQQIGAALAEPAQERSRRQRREEKILVEQAWDAIADSMETLMQTEWGKTPTGKAQRASARTAPAASQFKQGSGARQTADRKPAYDNMTNSVEGGE